MDLHIGFIIDCGKNGGVLVDHEREPPIHRARFPLRVECRSDDPIRVRKQGEPEIVQLVKLALLINLISADPHYPGPESCKLGFQIPEVTTFLGSAARHCLRVEVQHHAAVGEELAERDLRAELIEGRELGY